MTEGGNRGDPRETEPRMRSPGIRGWALGAISGGTAWGGDAPQAEWPAECYQTRVFLAARSRGHAAHARRCAACGAVALGQHRAIALPLHCDRKPSEPRSSVQCLPQHPAPSLSLCGRLWNSTPRRRHQSGVQISCRVGGAKLFYNCTIVAASLAPIRGTEPDLGCYEPTRQPSWLFVYLMRA